MIARKILPTFQKDTCQMYFPAFTINVVNDMSARIDELEKSLEKALHQDEPKREQ